MAQSNTNLFEAYFKLADLDHDGRINGNEAVGFFQGSNLTRQVLAQVWMIADQNQTGFLGRQEFYNMLKLITVAQSKTELTPDIVKAALYGPASAEIPAPQINLPPTSSQQVSVGTINVSASPQSAVTTSGPQIIGAMHPPINPSGQSQASWPKITRTDVQKYNKVFMQVDTDRDGKITGEQAHDLFLSWRQPREVLKQVWDLSDQDNDSMLSLREFCIALYLMERYREGHSLPESLPSSIMDETLFTISSLPTVAQGNAFQRLNPDIQQPQSVKGTRAVAFGGAGKPPRPLPVSQTEGIPQSSSKPKGPVLEKQILDQLSTEEQNSLKSKFQEATEAEKKVSELDKEILDAREKIEFYHTQMQELVFHKSRCANRLNVIMERVSTDKLEVDSLAKKYEEKCRQAGDVASKLTLEEATFRDIQEKKMELYRAISKLSQDGSANGFQERVSHIQQDLEVLVKSLNDRCKHYGLRPKPTSLVELPFGWQPGIQGPAADWNENWDKFEDEGFACVKELSLDGPNVIAPPKPKSSIVREKEGLLDEGRVVNSSDANVKLEKVENDADIVANNGVYTQSEEQPLHGSDSPTSSSGFDTGSRDVENSHYKMETSFDGSPHAIQREHVAAESDPSKDTVFDEPSWGTFDSQYNADDARDFNHTTTKVSESQRHDSSSLVGSDDWGLNPIKTGPAFTDKANSNQIPFFDSVPSTPIYNTSGGSPLAEENMYQRKNGFFDSVPSTPMYNTGSSPLADDMFHKKSPFSFPDSVPSTPMSNHVHSPRRSIDSFSRFDSFSTQDGGLFAPPQESSSSFSRFDSMRSTPRTQSMTIPGFLPQEKTRLHDSTRFAIRLILITTLASSPPHATRLLDLILCTVPQALITDHLLIIPIFSDTVILLRLQLRTKHQQRIQMVGKHFRTLALDTINVSKTVL